MMRRSCFQLNDFNSTTGMPDALSKTIPIWCCVLNRALFPEQPEFHELYVPPNAVSESERSQMLSRIPEGLDAFLQLRPDLAGLRAQISRPIRPTWVTQETDLSHYYFHPNEEEEGEEGSDPVLGEVQCEGAASVVSHPPREIFTDFRPVVCCTSSKRIVDGEMSGHTGYIQGAGDDTENWAHGLTPPVFWSHAEQLLATPEAQLPGLIKSLVGTAAGSAKTDDAAAGQAGTSSTAATQTPAMIRRLTPQIYVCSLPMPPQQSLPADAEWCTIALASSVTPSETWRQSAARMEVGVGRHKLASRNLRLALANICEFATQFLQASAKDLEGSDLHKDSGTTTGQEQDGSDLRQRRVLVACETGGRDLSIGVALALLCWCFEDDEGAVVRRDPASESVSFNKTGIKIRLGRIMMAMPDANPNRATLQSVNSFLMDWRN